MPQDIQLTIRLFGAFRGIHPEPVCLTMPAGVTVDTIKQALGTELTRLNPAFVDTSLLARSALATDRLVLPPEACLNEDAHLAILPPVCGG
jgi:molybdopterin converting factor small subunit